MACSLRWRGDTHTHICLCIHTYIQTFMYIHHTCIYIYSAQFYFMAHTCTTGTTWRRWVRTRAASRRPLLALRCLGPGLALSLSPALALTPSPNHQPQPQPCPNPSPAPNPNLTPTLTQYFNFNQVLRSSSAVRAAVPRVEAILDDCKWKVCELPTPSPLSPPRAQAHTPFTFWPPFLSSPLRCLSCSPYLRPTLRRCPSRPRASASTGCSPW